MKKVISLHHKVQALDIAQQAAILDVLSGKKTYEGPVIVGANLKTATSLSKQLEQITAYVDAVEKGVTPKGVFMVAPAMPLLKVATGLVKDVSSIKIMAQTVHGAFGKENTGETLAAHLKELGIEYCLVGHMEERKYLRTNFKLTRDLENAEMNQKVKQLVAAGIAPVIGIGDMSDERSRTKEVIKEQLYGALKDVSREDMVKLIIKGLTPAIAYEPAWAIGAVAASPADAETVNRYIRILLIKKFGAEVAANIAVMYGGSVTPINAKDFTQQPNINGSLVGGASYGVVTDSKGQTIPKIFAINLAH
jgi:triosephosphate isomerase